MRENFVTSILPSFVAAFDESGKIGGGLTYWPQGQMISADLGSGQLAQYYQHLLIEDVPYFGNRFFNLALLGLEDEMRDPEYLGLDCLENWQQKHYEIFAHTMAEDILFCDLGEEACPVYGLISGDDRITKLSDSLADFLKFYTALTRLEVLEFKREIFANEQLNYKAEFIAKVRTLIDQSSAGEAQEGLLFFLLDGADFQ